MSSPLSSVYQDPALADILPSQAFSEGYIFAIAASPEIPLPEQWMPGLVNGSSSTLDAAKVNKLADGMMFMLRDTLSAMRDGKVLLPDYVIWTEDKSKRADAEQWLTGLLMGHQSVENCWQQAWLSAQSTCSSSTENETPTKRLTRCLKFFSSLADIDLALHARTGSQAQLFREKLPALYKQLPMMLTEYVTLAGELAALLPNQFESFKATE
ncbi:UPF0149 family protein [Alteromonas ponticola]|uniref:UPF0149 family protein n=1 Tax=Alteromonas aquimaris TaxID=2998417 RepID=A0ABT3P5Y7_9ALTE|nr:UPF0149 family protein [Alteromonas aquimaris]MCW8107491.1 UPF0149 family protein [Alteromonas aquimaris]